MNRLTLSIARMLGVLLVASFWGGLQATPLAAADSGSVARSEQELVALQVGNTCDGGEGVYLYDETQYRGGCLKFTADVADLSTVAFNNAASSIRIIGDWTATLYVDQNYGNVASSFTRDDPDLSNDAVGSNRASSLRVQRGTTPEANRCDGGAGVYLYEHVQYQGRCLKFTSDVADLSTLGFNNLASSIAVVGNWAATLYIDQNFGGASSTFTGNDPELGNDTIGNDRASSLRVQQGGGVPAEYACNGNEGVYVYEHPNFQGRCARFTSDVTDLRTLNFDDIASSVRLVGEWTTTLYRDLNFTGIASSFSQEDTNLANDALGDNQATSIRVQRIPTTPAEYACTGESGVYVYEHPNFQGRCARFTTDVADLRTLNFDDIASSVRIVGSWTTTLYRDLNFTGTSSSFSQEDTNLANDPLGDNQATSIRVQRLPPDTPELACNGSEGVYVYEHPNFQGRCVRLTIDFPDLRTVGFDDTASSVRMVGSWTATLYRDLSFTGIASGFSQEDSNLANDPVGDNQATSIRVQRLITLPPENVCNDQPGVYVYEHPNYQGRCVRFTSDASDLRTFGFDDTASSVRFVGNWTATLYRDLIFTGVSSSFTQNDSNLADDALGDNQATSIRVQRR